MESYFFVEKKGTDEKKLKKAQKNWKNCVLGGGWGCDVGSGDGGGDVTAGGCGSSGGRC